MNDPVPSLVPLICWLQDPADRMQVFEAKLPPVVPGVRVKVTVPPGIFEGLVVSVTVTTTVVTQSLAPAKILQLTLPVLVDVSSLETVRVLEVPVLPLWVESPGYVPVTVAVPVVTAANVAVQ